MMSIGKCPEEMSWIVVHVVLVFSCGEEKIISVDVCVWLCCIGSMVGWMVLFKIVSW